LHTICGMATPLQPDGRSRGTPPVLTPDRDLRFPEFVLLKASAGSGKTHALSLRFVQFLLSDEVRRRTRDGLSNILAITFTRNSAREMKERVLAWLKNCRFDDAEQSRQVLEIVSLPARDLARRAEEAIEGIISGYSDFQVETIDSFMASVFRASAVDLDQPPDFEIVIDGRDLVEYAFSRYLRKVFAGSPDGELFAGILDLLRLDQGSKSSFAWDPAPQVLDKLAALQSKLTAQDLELRTEDLSGERKALLERLEKSVEKIEKLISSSGLERSAKSGYNTKILPAVRERRFAGILEASLKTPPVKKPRGKEDSAVYEKIAAAWEDLGGPVNRYKACYARSYFYPYLLAFRSFADTLDHVKRIRGTVFIEDIGRQLAGYIDQGIVPDIYFRLGDRIFHFLIDEFQDTSPIQWKNMVPLIENSLAQGGSLFVVGDTKQAIYGFRNADYRIMKELEDGGPLFGSTSVDVRELTENYRCRGAILEFVRRVFLEEARNDEKRGPIARLSGLDGWTQEAIAGRRDSGYVRYSLLERTPSTRKSDDGEEESGEAAGEDEPEKIRLQELIRELTARGYSYSDITVLTYKNENVARVAAWLNEDDVPFIPFSSLDIRKRKVVAETLRFLEFLDSPPDDLAFASFLTGDMFGGKLREDGRAPERGEWDGFLFDHRGTGDRPLYIAFRDRFPDLWDRYFEPFFKTVGYYPLYDLVTQIYRTFDVFRLFGEEEAALAKLLETIKNFEGEGRNDLRGFLEVSGDGDSADSGWTIDVPSDIQAVKIMSIHKAKGLGFPVVILFVYGESWRAPEFFLAAEEDGVHVLKITGGLAEADPGLRSVYDGVRDRDLVNQMNTLYVALTRAQSELYITGVKRPKDKYPFDLLGGAVDKLVEDGTWVRNEAGAASASVPPPACPKRGKPTGPQAEKHRLTGVFELPPNSREGLNYSGIRRGEMAHAILAEVENTEDGWDETVRTAIRSIRPLEPDVPAWEEVGAAIVRYFRDSPVRGLFGKKKGRKVLREASFCGADGRVFRMDRVIIDEDGITVLDYKTGTDPDPVRRAARADGDRAQVRRYTEILRDVFPGLEVRATLARIDEGTVEDVT
jgi:ATP-dependent helicase/nuclease subunit A